MAAAAGPAPRRARAGGRRFAARRMAVGAEGTLSLMEVGGSLLERVAVGNPLSLVLAASAFALSLGYLFQLGYRRHVGSEQKVGAGGRRRGGAVGRGGGAGGLRHPPAEAGEREGEGEGRGGGGAGRPPFRARAGRQRCARLWPALPGERRGTGGKIQVCGSRLWRARGLPGRLPRDGFRRERCTGSSLRPAGWCHVKQRRLGVVEAKAVPRAASSGQLKRRLPCTYETCCYREAHAFGGLFNKSSALPCF